jgi:integrative and conjugative element protein (TIGR02256 family)
MEVILPGHVQSRMKRSLWRAGRREIGGILMGRELSAGRFEIIDISTDSVSGARAHFVRDVGHHIAVLRKFFEQTGHAYDTFNYLGEWHSHPGFSVNPSSTDIKSMEDLVCGERNIDFAVLLIVRTKLFFQFAASATLHRKGAVMEAVDVILAS